MVEEMIESTTRMVDRWEVKGKERVGIAIVQVDEDPRNLSGEVISKTYFGSNYARGMDIFGKMLDLLSKQYALVGLPGLRHIPIKSNREVWKLGKEIESSILNLMSDGNSASSENLLEVLTKNLNGSRGRDGHRVIVDNCKAMFFGGYETTSDYGMCFGAVGASYGLAEARTERVNYGDIRDGAALPTWTFRDKRNQ